MTEQQQLTTMLTRAWISFDVITDPTDIVSWEKAGHVSFDTIVKINSGNAIVMDGYDDCYFFFDKGQLVLTGAE